MEDDTGTAFGTYEEKAYMVLVGEPEEKRPR